MEWLQSNWVWIALGIGFVALHWFGHGGHGHGRHGRYGRRDREPANTAPGATADHDHAIPTAATAANSNDPARRDGSGRSRDHAEACRQQATPARLLIGSEFREVKQS